MPGATRTCPHCRATILESEVVCPACRHHLRAGRATALAPGPATTPFRVEGTLAGRPGESTEYTVVVTIADAHGVELSRQVVGVGAMPPGEQRAFAVAVEMRAAR